MTESVQATTFNPCSRTMTGASCTFMHDAVPHATAISTLRGPLCIYPLVNLDG